MFNILNKSFNKNKILLKNYSIKNYIYNNINDKIRVTEYFEDICKNFVENVSEDEFEKYIFDKNINNIEIKVDDNNKNILEKYGEILEVYNKYDNICINVNNIDILNYIKKYNFKKISIDSFNNNNYLLKKNDVIIDNIIKKSNKDMMFKIYIPTYIYLRTSMESRYNDTYEIINKVENYYNKYYNKIYEICLVNNSDQLTLYDFKTILNGVRNRVPIEIMSFQNMNFETDILNKNLIKACLDNNLDKFNIKIENNIENKNISDITTIYYDKSYKLYKFNNLIEIHNYEKRFNKKEFL